MNQIYIQRGVLLSLVCAAIAIRLYGIDHGYPSLVTGDERPVCKNAVGFLVLHSLEPEHFNYPELYSYLFAGAIYCYYILGGLWQLGEAGISAGFTWFFSPGEVALVGRLLSAVMGGLSVGIVWLIGQRAYDLGTAWGGALFTAISVALVNQSRYALPDITMVFLCNVALLFLFDISRGGHWRSYVLAGLFIGLATSTKYNAGMACLGILGAHLAHNRGRISKDTLCDMRLFLAGGAMLVGFLGGSPYWIVSHEKYLHFLRYEQANMNFTLAGTANGYGNLVYGIISAEWAWGILAFAGCSYAISKRSSSDWILLSIIIPTLLYVGSWPKSSLHYIAFALPLMGLLGARLVLALAGPNMKLAILLMALLSIPNCWVGFESGFSLRQRDVRIAAANWIERHIESGTTIGVYSNQHGPILKKVQIEKHILDEMISGQADHSEAQQILKKLKKNSAFYNWIDLEYATAQPEVPVSYRDKFDMDNPKTRSIVNRSYLKYEQIKERGVELIVLPASAYDRFFDDSKMPQPDTVEYFHYMRNRSYIDQFINDKGRRYKLLQEFMPFNGDARGKIMLFQVM